MEDPEEDSKELTDRVVQIIQIMDLGVLKLLVVLVAKMHQLMVQKILQLETSTDHLD